MKKNKTLGNQFTSIVRKDTEQTNVAIYFYSVAGDSNKTEIAELLGIVLGGGMSSRLASSIRDEMGACYSIYARSFHNSNFGQFYIQTGINSNNFERVIKQIAVECSRLKTELLTAEELENAKQLLIMSTLINTETNLDRAVGYLHKYMRADEVITITEIINRINKVTAI